MLDTRKNSDTSRYLYQCYSNNHFWGCLDVEVMDSAVLGGGVEVVSLIPAVGHKIFFSIFRHSGFIISLHINLHYKSVSVSDPM